MPEEWPIAAPAADHGGQTARTAGRRRLATVRTDFFLDTRERLTEQERALMTAMLHALVSDIADEVRGALPSDGAVANDDDHPGLIAELNAAGLLDVPDFIELLLRRADEEQVSSALRARSGRREGRFLHALVSDDDAGVSAAAMALILARGRRRDRFGQPRIEFDDLPRAAASQLVRAVSAALRPRVAATTGTPTADRSLGIASIALLNRHDPTKALDVMTGRLIELLDQEGRLEDELIAVAADEGEIGFVAQSLARRSSIPSDEGVDILLSGNGEHLIFLLRMAGVSREFAARLLVGPGDLLGIEDPAREISLFDTIGPAEVEAMREQLQLDAVYRHALEALGGNGQRSV